MSVIATDLVYESSRSRRGARLVMLALARAADDRGEAKLSLTEIANLANLTPRAVTDCLRELSALGEVTYEPGVGRGNRNRYAILLGHLAGAAATPQAQVQNPSEAGSNFPEVASENRKSGAGSAKSAPGNGEDPSSRARGVDTPYGSINTPNKQASLPAPRDSTSRRDPESVVVPAGAQEVVAALEAAGMLVGWRLSAAEWERVTALSTRWGTARLVEVIARRWDPARPPQSARYLLRVWDDLPSQVPATAQGNVVPLRRESARWESFRNPAKPSAYQNGF